jgi:hypothetical protein
MLLQYNRMLKCNIIHLNIKDRDGSRCFYQVGTVHKTVLNLHSEHFGFHYVCEWIELTVEGLGPQLL